MKKLILLFCVVLMVFPLVMTGCGVSKDEYEAVVAERDAVKAQVASLQAEKDAAKAQVASLQAERDELQAVESDVTSLVAELEKKLAAAAMIFGYLSDSFKNYAGEMSASDFNAASAAFMADFGGVLDDVGNDELSQLWEDALAASGRNDEKGFSAKFAAIMDSFTGLIEEDIAAIEAKLS